MAPPNETFPAALAAGIKLLSTRDRSESQLRLALNAKGFGPIDIDAVVVRLDSKNILNDARFAESVVRKRTQKGIGLERIRQELSQLGLSQSVIDSVAGALDGDQTELAIETLRKRITKSPAVTRPGAFRFLAGKGFSEAEVEQAVDALLGASDPFAE